MVRQSAGGRPLRARTCRWRRSRRWRGRTQRGHDGRLSSRRHLRGRVHGRRRRLVGRTWLVVQGASAGLTVGGCRGAWAFAPACARRWQRCRPPSHWFGLDASAGVARRMQRTQIGQRRALWRGSWRAWSWLGVVGACRRANIPACGVGDQDLGGTDQALVQGGSMARSAADGWVARQVQQAVQTDSERQGPDRSNPCLIRN